MKAICIDSDGTWKLTSGKMYEIKIINDAFHCCTVIDDYGESIEVFTSRFKLLSDIREEKLNQLL